MALLLVGCGAKHPPFVDTSLHPEPGSETGGEDGNPGNGGGESAGGASSGRKLAAAAVITGSALVGYFYDESGVRIVDEAGVKLYDWDRSLRAQWKAERPLISAGYQTGTTVVADAGGIITLNDQLEPVHEEQVVEACIDGVLLSAGRFACGPDVDWDRTFYTYDAVSGDLLATSNKYTYNGRPMLPVPGRDEFVTVTTDLSPSDYHLYQLADDGRVSFIGESPYHGDFACTTVVGFLGNPATHLITRDGLMLAFTSADCVPEGGGCFVKDGSLGTLPGPDAHYVGLSNSQDGEMYAIVDTGDSYGGPCMSGCILQRIETETRDVVFDRVMSEVRFDPDTIAQAYYLIPTPDNESVWVIASGRSIDTTGYDDSLPYRIYAVDAPK